jgi:hypothetical protein
VGHRKEIAVKKDTKKKINRLIRSRTEFAGMGTRRTKLRLNKLAKHDIYAKALRIALEIEDSNLTAKRYYGGDLGGYTYAQVNYFKKASLIQELIQIAAGQGWVYGVHQSNVADTTHIIYFELPGVGQISWHFSPRKELPYYKGIWDRDRKSALPKLEAAINALFNCVPIGRAA